MGLPAGQACEALGLSDLAHCCALLAVSHARARHVGRPILVLQQSFRASLELAYGGKERPDPWLLHKHRPM